MDKIGIICNALQIVFWVIMLIINVLLFINIIKQKKTINMNYENSVQKLEDLSKQHEILINCDYDSKSDLFKKIIASFEIIKQLFAESLDEIEVYITPDLAEVLVNEGTGAHKEIAIGSFGAVNGMFFEVVGGRNDVYVAKKVKLEEMNNGK